MTPHTGVAWTEADAPVRPGEVRSGHGGGRRAPLDVDRAAIRRDEERKGSGRPGLSGLVWVVGVRDVVAGRAIDLGDRRASGVCRARLCSCRQTAVLELPSLEIGDDSGVVRSYVSGHP